MQNGFLIHLSISSTSKIEWEVMLKHNELMGRSPGTAERVPWEKNEPFYPSVDHGQYPLWSIQGEIVEIGNTSNYHPEVIK